MLRLSESRYSLLSNQAHTQAPTFRALVVLGSPRSKCNGAGICMVTSARVSPAEWKCPYLRADIFVCEGNKLCFRFTKSSTSSKRTARHFSYKLFQVVDPYALPAHVCKGIGLRNPAVILPGIYSVVESGEHWMVEIGFYQQSTARQVIGI